MKPSQGKPEKGTVMKLGTNFAPFIKRNSLENVLKKIAKAGFESVDFSLSYSYDFTLETEEEYFRGIRKLCDELGLWISQGHAPMAKANSEEAYFSDEYISRLKDVIRRAGYLGIPWLVVHPLTEEPIEGTSNAYTEEKRVRGFVNNIKFYKILEPEFKKAGVGCAIENLAQYDYATEQHCACFGSSSADLIRIVDELNGRDGQIFGACLDVGHANLIAGESLPAFIKNLGNKLKCVHLHDNWGILTSWGGGLDRHLLPFQGQMPWQDIKKALEEINFEGAFSFECINYMPNDEFDTWMAEYIYKAGRYILNG